MDFCKRLKKIQMKSQLESEFGGRGFGIATNMDFLLVYTYEENEKIQNL